MTEDSPGGSTNLFEAGKPGTAGRTRSEARIEDLRRRGGVFVEAVRAARMAMVLTDPALPGNPIIFANQSFLDLSGYELDEVLGQQPFFMNGPDTDPEDAARFRQGLAEDRDQLVETIQYRKDGSRFVATVLLSAFKSEDSQTRHQFLSWSDVTRRANAEADAERLRARQRELSMSEARYRALFERMDEAYAVIDVLRDEGGRWADFRFVEVNPAFTAHSGMPDPVGKTAVELLGTPNPRWAELYGQVAETGEALRVEESEPTLGRVFDLNIFRLGEPGSHRVAVLFTDVTERRRADEALREGEQRLRLIIETARDYAIFTTDPQGRIQDWLPGAEAVFGWTPEDVAGQPIQITYTPEDVAAGVPQQERDTAAAEGRAPNVRWHVRKGGGRVFIDGIAAPLRSARGDLIGFLKIGQDTTERRRAQEHERMLLGELQHRVRNTLGVIRSIGRRTAEQSETVEEMWSHLEGRIDAFSRVQSVVTRNPETGLDLKSLIEDELRAHAAREGERVRLAGPDLLLKPRAAETLSLAIHELATNAVKYGALSAAAGMLAVTWARDEGRLRLRWEESGLRNLPANPARQGFGLELLERTLPYELDAESAIEFRPQGLRFTLSMPLGSNLSAG